MPVDGRLPIEKPISFISAEPSTIILDMLSLKHDTTDEIATVVPANQTIAMSRPRASRFCADDAYLAMPR